MGFVSRLIDFMVERYRVDRRRVYATGHSNGAQISYRLACELADEVAAIAPNASQAVFEGCRPVKRTLDGTGQAILPDVRASLQTDGLSHFEAKGDTSRSVGTSV